MRYTVAVALAMGCIAADASGSPDSWVQTSAVVVLCSVVIWELRGIRKAMDTMALRLARYAGEGRRLKSISDSPDETGRES